MIMDRHVFDLYVGSETGLLKGINLDKKTWCNINSVEQANRQLEIKVMCWGDASENEVCISLKNQTVCVFNTSEAEVTANHDFSSGQDDLIVGIGKYNSNFVTCTKSGIIKVWDSEDEIKTEIQAGCGITKMIQNLNRPNLVATGGDENDLKVWDLEQPSDAIFKAKNVRNDWLNLRVPVNVANIEFIPNTEKIVTSTGYHQVRVYDPSTPMRRPVLDMSWGEYPINALSLRANNNQVFVGNTHGEMALLDIRKSGYEVMKYKGFAGAIRDIKCHKSLDFVASCGLDRFLRIYDINSTQMVEKFYLKSRLNGILFSSRLFGASQSDSDDESGMKANNEQVPETEEDIWDSIAVIQPKPKSKKRKLVDDQTENNLTNDSASMKSKGNVKKKKVPTATLR